MATVYSDEVAIDSYNRIRIKCDYSGTSATCEIQFRRTSSYSTTWADTAATFTFNGTTVSAAYSYTGTVGTDWVTLKSGLSGFSISSTESKTYSWAFTNSSGVLGCSGSIYISAQATAPTGLALSNTTRLVDGFTGTVSITSWGNGGTTSDSYLEMSIRSAASASASYVINKAFGRDSLSATITASNSKYEFQNMTIQPNTMYYLTMYATNGAMATGNTSFFQHTTLPPALSAKSVGTITSSSIQINYTTTADGGKYTKNIQYSLDNSTWTTGATVSSASATSGSFTISGLSAGTSYTIYLRVNTTAGSTSSGSLTTTTLSPLYGSVDGKTKLVKKLYGSVNGVTKEVKHLYGSVNGVTKKIF